jgi:hypothetical protein
MGPVRGELAKGRPAEPANGDWSNRIGGEAVTAGRAHSQKIAGQGEADDLAAAVRQELVKPHDTLEQIIEPRRHVLLGEHRLAGGEMDVTAEMPEFSDLVTVERGANAGLSDRAILTGLSARLERKQGRLHMQLPNRSGRHRIFCFLTR